MVFYSFRFDLHSSLSTGRQESFTEILNRIGTLQNAHYSITLAAVPGYLMRWQKKI
jgi:hypothetical protein